MKKTSLRQHGPTLRRLLRELGHSRTQLILSLLCSILQAAVQLVIPVLIGLFAVSTYNTDYILVQAGDFGRAMNALAAAGYTVL